MNQNNHYDVVIVGAGIAGITAAAYLGKKGLRVLLCEKNEKPGGLVGSFQKEGFTFDSGIRAFENSGIVFPMLKQLGIKIEFKNNPVAIGIENAIVPLSSKASLQDYQELLNSIFKDNKEDIEIIIQEIKKTIKYMDVLYGIDNPLFMDLTKDKQYLMKVLLPWLIKYQINIRKVNKLNEPINQYLGKITGNQSLIDMITQHFFQNTPTFFALSYFGLYLDYNYPLGGTGVLIDKLVEYILHNDVEIMTRCLVNKIDISNKTINTESGLKIGYNHLVWCADMNALYTAIEDESLKDIKLQKELINRREVITKNRGCDSILSVYLAIDKDKEYFKKISGEHIFYTPTTTGLSSPKLGSWESIVHAKLDVEYEKFELKRWIALYLSLTTYEISCPVLRDETLSPNGKTGLIISTLFDYNLTKHIAARDWYDEFKNYAQEQIKVVLNQSIYPGFIKNIIFSDCSTPLTIQKFTGNLDGAITGWAFNPLQMPSEKRFIKIAKSIETPFPNIYQAGQWTFSPAGLPVCIITGKLAADAVNKKLKQSKK